MSFESISLMKQLSLMSGQVKKSVTVKSEPNPCISPVSFLKQEYITFRDLEPEDIQVILFLFFTFPLFSKSVFVLGPLST